MHFRKKYSLNKSVCERPEQTKTLEDALARVTGAAMKLEFALDDDEPEEAASAAAPKRAPAPMMSLKQKAEHPFVRKASELFGAQPVRVVEETQRST